VCIFLIEWRSEHPSDFLDEEEHIPENQHLPNGVPEAVLNAEGFLDEEHIPETNNAEINEIGIK